MMGLCWIGDILLRRQERLFVERQQAQKASRDDKSVDQDQEPESQG
jgi:hypothetical protein